MRLFCLFELQLPQFRGHVAAEITEKLPSSSKRSGLSRVNFSQVVFFFFAAFHFRFEKEEKNNNNVSFKVRAVVDNQYICFFQNGKKAGPVYHGDIWAKYVQWLLRCTCSSSWHCSLYRKFQGDFLTIASCFAKFLLLKGFENFE